MNKVLKLIYIQSIMTFLNLKCPQGCVYFYFTQSLRRLLPHPKGQRCSSFQRSLRMSRSYHCTLGRLFFYSSTKASFQLIGLIVEWWLHIITVTIDLSPSQACFPIFQQNECMILPSLQLITPSLSILPAAMFGYIPSLSRSWFRRWEVEKVRGER